MIRRTFHSADARRDAASCAAVVREHGRTFYAASWLLSPAKRRDAYALYAFCRVADDLVDRAQGRYGDATDPAEVARVLGEYEEALAQTLGAGPPTAALPPSAAPHAPVFRELRRVVRAHGVPHAALRELLAGVACDLAPARYATWAELVAYCEGVASSVGEMCTYVFGVAETGDRDRLRARALPYARTLGVAMQLTNILRDVGEDARRGRCYLAAADLAAFGLTAGEVLDAAADEAGARATALARDPRWAEFVAAMIARARALYAAAEPGIALLAPDARRCATACSTGYAGILGAIERAGYDTLTRRAYLTRTHRAAVLWRAWRDRRPGFDVAGALHGPTPDPVSFAPQTEMA